MKNGERSGIRKEAGRQGGKFDRRAEMLLASSMQYASEWRKR